MTPEKACLSDTADATRIWNDGEEKMFVLKWMNVIIQNFFSWVCMYTILF